MAKGMKLTIGLYPVLVTVRKENTAGSQGGGNRAFADDPATNRLGRLIAATGNNRCSLRQSRCLGGKLGDFRRGHVRLRDFGHPRGRNIHGREHLVRPASVRNIEQGGAGSV